jgi:hypothetical protein
MSRRPVPSTAVKDKPTRRARPWATRAQQADLMALDAALRPINDAILARRGLTRADVLGTQTSQTTQHRRPTDVGIPPAAGPRRV